MGQSLWKIIWQLPKEIKLNLTGGQGTLGHLSQKNKNCCPRKYLYEGVQKLYSVTAKNEKQPKCPRIANRMNHLWYVHTMEYYSVKKKEHLIYNKMHGPQNNYSE